MLTSAAPIANLGDDVSSRMLSVLDNALVRAASASDMWFDDQRQRPCALIDGVPVQLPHPTKAGECSRSIHVSTRDAVGRFKQHVIDALAPGIGDRRMRHFLALASREGGTGQAAACTEAILMAQESGALELAHHLAEIREARQRPPVSHLEHAFAAWISEQALDASGSIVVMERQARIDIERIVAEEVQPRMIRRLASWHGFRRVHARRARLLIRP